MKFNKFIAFLICSVATGALSAYIAVEHMKPLVDMSFYRDGSNGH